MLVTEVGNRNTGDELAYAATARRFLAEGWRVAFLCRVRPRAGVLSDLPVDLHDLLIEDFFEGVTSPAALAEAFARRHPEAFAFTRDLVRAHDLVAVAPGGRFTSGYNNPRALLTAAVALGAGVPVVNLPQSVGPLDRESDRRLVGAVFAASRLNLVRDDLSHAFLLRLGVPAGRLVLTRDVAFGEHFAPGAGPRFDLGINIRHGFNGHANLDVLRAFLVRLNAERPGLQPLVYSTSHVPDDRLAAAVAGLARIEPEMPRWEGCLHVPSSCRVIISDSYHGAIFGLLAGRPVLCCPTDFSSWKLQGTTFPPLGSLEVLPGFATHEDIPQMVGRALAALDHAEELADRQGAGLAHARRMSEDGWRALWAVLREPNGRKETPCAPLP